MASPEAYLVITLKELILDRHRHNILMQLLFDGHVLLAAFCRSNADVEVEAYALTNKKRRK